MVRSGIRDPGSGIQKKPIPDPGSRIRGAKRYRIPDPDPQHWLKSLTKAGKRATSAEDCQRLSVGVGPVYNSTVYNAKGTT
jgi:hypothetical protein